MFDTLVADIELAVRYDHIHASFFGFGKSLGQLDRATDDVFYDSQVFIVVSVVAHGSDSFRAASKPKLTFVTVRCV